MSDGQGAALVAIPTGDVAGQLGAIFGQIANSKGTTFQIAEAENLAALLRCASIKAPSADKADIVASILDRSTGMAERAGFSVKSLVGGASTLLNAGKTTNFIYEVTGLPSGAIDEVNAITGAAKIRDRVARIQALGGALKFRGLHEPTFSRNLRKIDTMLPEFLAEMVFQFYCGAGSAVSNLAEGLAQNEALNAAYGLSAADYAFKVKQLLVSIALGLVPSKLWDGLMLAHGGYLVVKPQGAVLCYHAIHRDLFLEYLYKNTKFETASSERHNFGKLYMDSGIVKMNLNLQIRFK